MGYVVCQPGNDEASNAAMQAYQYGKDLLFMKKSFMAVLHPVAFGSRRCRGNKVCLHSHMGEGFYGDYAMNKCRHYLFGQQFVWVTNCNAIKFILSYNGANHTILCLQMCLMGWDVNIVHRNDHYITNADYWSHLGADLCFNPLFKTYLDLMRTLRNNNPSPSSFPMKPENMPYYRGPRVITPSNFNTSSDANHCQTIVSTVLINNCHGLCHLSNIPVKFWQFRPGNTVNLTISPQQRILLSCATGFAIQLGGLLVSGWTLCLNYSHLKLAVSHHIGL
jgi:hypothetical protein